MCQRSFIWKKYTKLVKNENIGPWPPKFEHKKDVQQVRIFWAIYIDQTAEVTANGSLVRESPQLWAQVLPASGAVRTKPWGGRSDLFSHGRFETWKMVFRNLFWSTGGCGCNNQQC